MNALSMEREMLAPCGMNCNLCSWGLDPGKPGCAGGAIPARAGDSRVRDE
ncbi:MAG: hypothetical protein JXO51_02310 [Candidatus Aminicenantes bacterium]|nr:hypothetical protein [Candidatus Aminicenantes bacterium]